MGVLVMYVLVCGSMCCLRCVVGCRRCVGRCVVMTVQKRKTTYVISESPAREFIPITVLISSKKLKPNLSTVITVLIYSKKIESALRISVIIFAEMVFPKSDRLFFVASGTRSNITFNSCSSLGVVWLRGKNRGTQVRHGNPHLEA